MISGGPGPAACEWVSCSRTRVSLVRPVGCSPPSQTDESKWSLGTQADALCSGRQGRRRGTALHDKYMAGFGFQRLAFQTHLIVSSITLALHFKVVWIYTFQSLKLVKFAKLCFVTNFACHAQYLPFFWLAVSFFHVYLCPPNPHYSLVPRCTKSLTNKGAIFHLLSPNSSTTPSLYSISICLSPIPLEWLSQTGCQLWKGFVGAELHSGSNQLPVRPFAGQPAPPCVQAGFIYQTTILQGIYHFHTAMHSVIYKC